MPAVSTRLGCDQKRKNFSKSWQPTRFKLPRDLKGFSVIKGAYARRTNIHNRLVYEVLERERIVKIIRMWTHYE